MLWIEVIFLNQSMQLKFYLQDLRNLYFIIMDY